MCSDANRGFWLTNHLANPMLRPLLRGPLGRRWGRRLAVMRYRGRRTGQAHELVVQYVREGDRVWVMPGQPDRKRWWRNMREPLAVEMRLAGHDVRGTAVALDAGDAPDEVAAAVTTYRTVFPRATGPAAVMVRIDLEAAT